jgi:hypothetical protein
LAVTGDDISCARPTDCCVVAPELYAMPGISKVAGAVAVRPYVVVQQRDALSQELPDDDAAAAVSRDDVSLRGALTPDDGC